MCQWAVTSFVMSRGTALPHVAIPATAAAKPLVVACGLARQHRHYAEDGLRLAADVRYVDGFDELDELLPDLTGCDALILAAVDARGRTAIATIERVVREWPETGVVMFCPARANDAPPARALVLAGAHELVYEGVHPTAGHLAVAVENARRYVAATSVSERMEPLVPEPARSMVHAVLAQPERVTSVDELARSLGVHRKTLFNRCERARFLQPGELIMWCRLAMAARMLDRSGATIESIAQTLGFPSHTALRNRVKSYLGCTATEARRRGALALVLETMRARIVPAGRPELHIR
jgi:AraC-like DNA-binding protein